MKTKEAIRIYIDSKDYDRTIYDIKNGVLELLKEDFMKSNNQETLNEARELNSKSGHQLLQYIERLGYIVKGCSCNPENCKVMRNC